MNPRCLFFTLVLFWIVPAISFGQSCDNWAKITGNVSGIQIGDLDIPGNQITVEAVFNRTAPYFGSQLYAGDLVSKHEGPSTVNYLLRPNSAEITTSNGYFKTPDICDIQLNKTYHVAMVYDGKILKFYRNGFLMSSINCSGDLFQNDYITTIGSLAVNPNVTNENLVGYIDEVRIWKVVRSQNDIKKYMNQPLPNPATQAGLLAYYTFDDLKNKQGNTKWNGKIVGDAKINQTNPTCASFVADSCNIKPVNVVANFTGPDTVCVNDPVQFTNLSTGASNYYWSFCTAGFNTTPLANNLGNPGSLLNAPVFMDYEKDGNGNFYGFISNYANGHIVRLNYGNSLLNTPTSDDLGNFNGLIPIYAEGIQVKEFNDKCYVFVVAAGDDAGNGSTLIRLDFGSSFANAPTAINLGNIGGLLFPHDLFIASENNNFYGFTINIKNNTITRFDFGNDLDNTPSGVNLGSIGNFNYPCGFSFLNTNGNWYAFVANRDNNSITRLNFGSSITNIPNGINIGNPGSLLNRPRDISLFQSCDGIVGLVVNEEDETTGSITKLDFGDNVSSGPQAINLGNTGKLKFPHSISKFFLEGNDIYSFITNVANNTITRLRYTGCTSTNIASSTAQTPPSVTYTSPGIYNVNLLVDIGLPTQASFCKQIVIDDCRLPVIANFVAPDTVCINSTVTITNTSSGATTYYWSFCQADLNKSPVGKNLGNINSSFSLPVYSDIVSQNGSYYAFVVNNHPGGISRLDFGNSLLNTPALVNLGNPNNVITDNAEGIQVINTGNHWYAIMVGGDDFYGVTPQIIKLDFGSDITNTSPVATDWGNIGEMAYPHKLYMFNENNKWYGVTANTNNNTITRFDFGYDFANPPIGSNLGSFGILNGPTGLNAIKDNNKWYVFVTNMNSNSITRLDFGNSLLNTPNANDLGNISGTMHECFDIYIQKYCDDILGFVVNGDESYNDIVRLNFNNDLKSVPSAVSLGNIGNLSFPHSFSKLFRVENDLYTIIPNAHNNTLTRLKFSGCTNSNISGTNKVNPPEIIYDSAGVYNINLSVDEGLPTQTSFCKQIVVIDCDTVCDLQPNFIYAQQSCDPASIHFQSTTINADSIWWDFGNGITAGNVTDTIIKYSSFGIYSVNLFAKTDKGCLDTAEYKVNVDVVKSDVIINADTAVCAGSSVQLNSIDGLNYCWSPSAGLSNSSIKSPVATPLVTTKYYLHVLMDSSKPVLMDSVIITVLPLPDIKVSNDTIVCGNASVQLNAYGASSYTWSPSSGLSNTTIADPIATVSSTTMYVVAGTANNACSAQDSVIITVNPIPVFAINPKNPSVCLGDSIILTATGGDIFQWLPGENISNPSSSTPVIYPAFNTTYTVIINNSICKLSDTLNTDVTINEAPDVALTKSNDVDCLTPQAMLTASGGIKYTWEPATFISNTHVNNPVVSPPSDTWYSVNVENQNGCKGKDSILVKSSFVVGASPFQVPGAFTPNSDGLNDCFSLRNWGPVDYFDILIYDRWGYLVFHSNNINSCWDGTVKGIPQGAGTFVYQIRVSSKCTEGVVTKKGTLVLIR